MACEYCLGDPNGCPVCGGKPLIPCPDCDDGYHYFLIDPDAEEYIPCTREDYDKAVPEYRERETCPTCKGEVWL